MIPLKFIALALLLLFSCRAGAEAHPAFFLMTGDFATLERYYGNILDAYAKGHLSDDDLTEDFRRLKDAGPDGRFDEWVVAYPKSYAALLARGIRRVVGAWDRRGSDTADKTTDAQFKEFSEGLRLAKKDLLASIYLYPRPIASYAHLMMVARGDRRNIDLDRRKLLEAGLKIDPRAYWLRKEYLVGLEPKWGGSLKLMDEFVKECLGSPMNDKDKARIEALHYTARAWYFDHMHAYRQASDMHRKAYQFDHKAETMYWSAKAAADGNLPELALERYGELIAAHPDYRYGYRNRGYLYETHSKNEELAFKDYLAAAEHGDDWAQANVGWWYMAGRYVAKDFDQAERYLKLAAAQNNPNAIANLVSLERLRKEANGKR